MKSETRDSLIWAFCIAALLLVAFRLVYQGERKDCDSCTVDFKDKLVFEDKLSDVFTFKIMDLFNAYNNKGECLIHWDPVAGYGGADELFE